MEEGKPTGPQRVSTLAGGPRSYADGPGALARFNHPFGVAVATDGTVYVADSDNNRIRIRIIK